MKRVRFTEQQIASTLKRAELGATVEQVCRMMRISDTTFYNWKKKYGGLEISETQRLEQLAAENAKLKMLVADLTLDNAMLQDVLSKEQAIDSASMAQSAPIPDQSSLAHTP